MEINANFAVLMQISRNFQHFVCLWSKLSKIDEIRQFPLKIVKFSCINQRFLHVIAQTKVAICIFACKAVSTSALRVWEAGVGLLWR